MDKEAEALYNRRRKADFAFWKLFREEQRKKGRFTQGESSLNLSDRDDANSSKISGRTLIDGHCDADVESRIAKLLEGLEAAEQHARRQIAIRASIKASQTEGRSFFSCRKNNYTTEEKKVSLQEQQLLYKETENHEHLSEGWVLGMRI